MEKNTNNNQQEKVYGLHCSILRNLRIGDCSAGGISSRVEAVTLVGEGIPEVFPATDDAPAVVVHANTFAGKKYFHVDPKNLFDAGKWTMAGGAFIWTSDSRFPFDYPLALHDREN